MQSSKMDIGIAVLLLENCTMFIKYYRTTEYTEAIQSAQI